MGKFNTGLKPMNPGTLRMTSGRLRTTSPDIFRDMPQEEIETLIETVLCAYDDVKGQFPYGEFPIQRKYLHP